MYLFSTSFVKRNKMHIFQLIAGYYLIFSTRQYAQRVMLSPVLPSSVRHMKCRKFTLKNLAIISFLHKRIKMLWAWVCIIRLLYNHRVFWLWSVCVLWQVSGSVNVWSPTTCLSTTASSSAGPSTTCSPPSLVSCRGRVVVTTGTLQPVLTTTRCPRLNWMIAAWSWIAT